MQRINHALDHGGFGERKVLEFGLNCAFTAGFVTFTATVNIYTESFDTHVRGSYSGEYSTLWPWQPGFDSQPPHPFLPESVLHVSIQHVASVDKPTDYVSLFCNVLGWNRDMGFKPSKFKNRPRNLAFSGNASTISRNHTDQRPAAQTSLRCFTRHSSVKTATAFRHSVFFSPKIITVTNNGR